MPRPPFSAFLKATVACSLLLFSASAIAQTSQAGRLFFSETPSALPHLPDPNHRFVYTWRVIPAAGNSYGYDVFADSTLLIHQAEKPGSQDHKGFATSENAGRAASYIIGLLTVPVKPPVVSNKELEAMHIY